MDYTISLQEVFWLCAGLAGVVGVVSIIRKPFTKLDDHERRLKLLEETATQRGEADRFTMRALNAIVNHMIDGNGIEALKSVRDEYQNKIIENQK